MSTFGITQPVFGVELDQIMSYQKETFPELSVPLILLLMRDSFIQLDGFNQEGIFRVPGKQDEVDGYRDLFNQGKYEIWKECNPNTIAGLFKLFLRDLPTPIVPPNLYDNFVDQDVLDELESDDKSLEMMNKLLQLLPQHNRSVFIFLINFLQLLSKHEEQTKMGVDNLAMVFSAAMLISPDLDPFSALTKTNLAKGCIAQFIEKLSVNAFLQLPMKVPNYEEGSGMKLLEENPIDLWVQMKKEKEMKENEKGKKGKDKGKEKEKEKDKMRKSFFGGKNKGKDAKHDRKTKLQKNLVHVTDDNDIHATSPAPPTKMPPLEIKLDGPVEGKENVGKSPRSRSVSTFPNLNVTVSSTEEAYLFGP